MDALRRRVGHLTEALGRARSSVIEQSEPEIVRLALAVAERVVREQIRVEPATMMRWVRDAIGALSDAASVVIAVAPDVASAIDRDAWKTGPGAAELLIDASLPPGGCEVRSGSSVASVSIDDCMEVVRETLGIDGQ